MSYYGHLKHFCEVKRVSGVAIGEGGHRVPTYTTVTGMEAVECRFEEGVNESDKQAFGQQVKADGIVLFEPGTDIRPRPYSDDGKLDQLTITDENQNVSTWLVIKCLDPGSRRRYVVAAVKRWAG